MRSASRFGASSPDAAEVDGMEGSTSPAEPDLDASEPRRGVHGGRVRFRDEQRRLALVIALVVLLAVPMIVALVALLHPRWYPLLDMAWIEMRLRDVWSSHPPLLGLAGRIGPAGHGGSHPGPLAFYAMWPFYELFGATAWAMEATAVVLNGLAIGALLWIANRRGGAGLVLGVAAVLAVFLRAFGAVLLTQPWNPYLPVLWWLVFLFAVWSVLCDDLMLLPVAAVVGSLCAQTEVAYLGLTVGLGLLALGVAAYRARQHWDDADARRRFNVAALVTVAAVLVVWIPPVIEELSTGHGNLSVLFDYFTHPPDSPVGLQRGVSVLVAHLNPITVIRQPLVPTTTRGNVGTGALVPGSVFLGLWALCAALSWRLRARSLVWLHVLIGTALVLGALSISRIFGLLWYYLTLWGWGLNAVMVVAVGWTLALLVGRRLEGAAQPQVARAGAIALAGLVVAMVVLFSVEAGRVERPTPRLADQLGRVVDSTARALEQSGPDHGRDGRYLVTFRDPNSIGAQAFGLMNELERRGFSIGALPPLRSPMTPYRVLDAAHARAVLHFSVGPDIDVWRAKPDAREVGYADVRTPKQRATYARLHAQVVDELETAGFSDQVPTLDENLFGLSLNQHVPATIRRKITRLAQLGLPIAVFLAPPSEG